MNVTDGSVSKVFESSSGRDGMDVFLSDLPEAFVHRVKSRIGQIEEFIARGYFGPEDYRGKTVLDWEAGDCAFSVAFLALGAAEVFAIDSWTEQRNLPHGIHALNGFVFSQCSVGDWSKTRESSSEKDIEFIFSNTVTEHIDDLPRSFDALHRMLSKDGVYFNNHDNYFSPCGSHDHGFWYYGRDGYIECKSVECWKSEERCASSREHRRSLREGFPWTWPETSDLELTPDNCLNCRYFKRSQPWAHLQFVKEFPWLFNDPSFLSRRPGSSLNKVTPFQLVQLLSEAGFVVSLIDRSLVNNEPIPAALKYGISRLDLMTANVRTLCRREAKAGENA